MANGMMTMQRLKAAAVGLVTIGVLLTVGLQVMVSLGDSMEIEEVITDESDINDTALPDNYTLDESNDANFKTVEEGSVTVVFNDSSAGTTTTLTQGTEYEVFNDEGKIEIKDTSTVGDPTSSDEFLTDYTAVNEDTDATQGSNDTVTGLGELSSFLPIIGLVIAAASVIGLVSGSFGRKKRGRA